MLTQSRNLFVSNVYPTENLDEDLQRFTISRQTINMLNKRRETVIETRKVRKSQLIQHNNMNDPNRNGTHGSEKWLRNGPSPSPPQYSPSIDRRGFQGGHVNEAFELDTYNNETETPRSRRRHSKITFA